MTSEDSVRVSIITPTYNHGPFIARCMASVAAQTYGNWEQIVIDDGSTDETADIVRRHGDPRVRYERQQHAGILALADTYNRALLAARGELVSILEGDDLWAPEKLELLVPRLADPAVVLAYGRTLLVAGERITDRSIPDPRFARRFGRPVLYNDPPGTAAVAMLHAGVGSFTFPAAVLIRRSALEAIGGFAQVSDLGAVDYPTLLTLSLRGRFEYVDRVVAYWRRHAGSSSWVRHQRILQVTHEFARSFMLDHAAQLELGADQVRKIERGWQRHLRRAAVNAGRYLLTQGKWPEARGQFLQALRSPDPVVFGGAFIGYVASLLRTDIEGFLSAMGRISFQSDHAAERDPGP